MPVAGIDRARLRAIEEREDARYVAERPRTLEILARARASMPNGVPMTWFASDFDPPVYVAESEGAHFTDVDGHDYVDFNVADMSMFCGYAPEPLVEAVARRVAIGNQFMLPTEDAVWVAEELARRWGLPKWQFTLSASQANTEVIRIARAATGRDKVLLFDGKYHGHFDDALVDLDDQGNVVPEERGVPANVVERARIVQFNDIDAVRDALAPRDVAIVLAEPAMTNNQGLILPEPGFLDALRAATRATETVLAYDETHTLVTGPGGLIARWDLGCDAVVLGKSIAGGVPLGAYGLAEKLAAQLELGPRAGAGFAGHNGTEVATGGTLFANALSMAAARAVLDDVLVDEAYRRTAALGARLADGIEKGVRSAGLDWAVHRFWPRSGVTFAPAMPTNAIEARASFDLELVHVHRKYLANRGVWEAIAGAGPTVAVPATEGDVDRYVVAFGELLRELMSS